MGVSGSPQQRVFVVVGSCRESLGATGSREEPWESTPQPKYLGLLDLVTPLDRQIEAVRVPDEPGHHQPNQ